MGSITPISNLGEINLGSLDARFFTIDERPARTPRRLKIIGIGGGMSGIMLALQGKERSSEFDLKIFEKGSRAGGNWFWNHYPGVACDNAAVTYQFIREQKRDWPNYFSRGHHIRDYLQGIVSKHSLEDFFCFEHEVTKCEWSDENNKWTVTTKNLSTGEETNDEADFVFECTGPLHHPKWPLLNNINSYKRVLIHSSRWPNDLDLKGKSVALIGTGATGIQILPELVGEASQVYTWIRQPTWIFPLTGSKYNYEYTPEQLQRFNEDPKYFLKYRKGLESAANKTTRVLIRGTSESIKATKLCEEHMREKLASRPDIMEKIIPKNFAFACRRPTPGPGYLEALCDDRVKVFLNDMRSMTETGFIDHEGSHHEVDVFICATGYDSSYTPFFPIISRGENLQDRWTMADPDPYLGYAVPGFPNYFMTAGPFGPTAQGAAPPIGEIIIETLLNICRKVAEEQIVAIEPKREAADDFLNYCKLWLPRTVFMDPCKSWWKATKSGYPLCFPGSRVQLIETIKNFRAEDWNYKYISINRFRYLGNGFHPKELGNNDDTYYLGLLDGKNELPDYTQIMKENEAGEVSSINL